MALSKKIERFLSDHKVEAELVTHKTVFTVYDLAQTLREDLGKIIKTLLVKADGIYFLVVMPANYRLDIQKFKKAIKAKKVSLASEKEMKAKFNVQPGSMVPFGPLHKLQVVADISLIKLQKALFGAGSFTESVRLKMKDYIKAVQPHVAAIGQRAPIKLQIVKKKIQKAKKKKTLRPKRGQAKKAKR